MAAAVGLQDRESSFQNDDALLPEMKTFSRSGSGAGSVSNGLSPVGSSWSVLSSPFGSELGSTETESEEADDEFMAELTRQMADYMLQEDDDDSAVLSPPKNCDFKEFVDSKFRVSSESNVAPIPPHDYQAFGDEQDRDIHICKVENKPSNQVKECKQEVSKIPDSTQQSEYTKPHRLQNKSTVGVLRSKPAVWPAPQMKYGSGMRAVFLGGSDSKTRTTGTGVFLPHGVSNPPAVRKKLGCSTVLIPARVLHTLQQHFENVKNRSQSDGFVGLKSYAPQYDASPAQAKRHSQSQSHSTNKTREIGLPQEWTY